MQKKTVLIRIPIQLQQILNKYKPYKGATYTEAIYRLLDKAELKLNPKVK